MSSRSTNNVLCKIQPKLFSKIMFVLNYQNYFLNKMKQAWAELGRAQISLSLSGWKRVKGRGGWIKIY